MTINLLITQYLDAGPLLLKIRSSNFELADRIPLQYKLQS